MSILCTEYGVLTGCLLSEDNISDNIGEGAHVRRQNESGDDTDDDMPALERVGNTRAPMSTCQFSL